MTETQPNDRDLDPDEALVEGDYTDPTPPEITDPAHPDYVEPGREYGTEVTA